MFSSCSLSFPLPFSAPVPIAADDDAMFVLSLN